MLVHWAFGCSSISTIGFVPVAAVIFGMVTLHARSHTLVRMSSCTAPQPYRSVAARTFDDLCAEVTVSMVPGSGCRSVARVGGFCHTSSSSAPHREAWPDSWLREGARQETACRLFPVSRQCSRMAPSPAFVVGACGWKFDEQAISTGFTGSRYWCLRSSRLQTWSACSSSMLRSLVRGRIRCSSRRLRGPRQSLRANR